MESKRAYPFAKQERRLGPRPHSAPHSRSEGEMLALEYIGASIFHADTPPIWIDARREPRTRVDTIFRSTTIRRPAHHCMVSNHKLPAERNSNVILPHARSVSRSVREDVLPHRCRPSAHRKKFTLDRRNSPAHEEERAPGRHPVRADAQQDGLPAGRPLYSAVVRCDRISSRAHPCAGARSGSRRRPRGRER